MQDQKPFNQFDVLRHIEKMTEDMNYSMDKRSRSVFRKYPLTFAILVLFAVAAVSEGVKGILDHYGFTNHPVYLLIAGLIILIITGRLYKKLDK